MNVVTLQESHLQPEEVVASLMKVVSPNELTELAKELEMSSTDDLRQFYKNGGDHIELAQALRAIDREDLANK